MSREKRGRGVDLSNGKELKDGGNHSVLSRPNGTETAQDMYVLILIEYEIKS